MKELLVHFIRYTPITRVSYTKNHRPDLTYIQNRWHLAQPSQPFWQTPPSESEKQNLSNECGCFPDPSLSALSSMHFAKEKPISTHAAIVLRHRRLPSRCPHRLHLQLDHHHYHYRPPHQDPGPHRDL